MWKSPPTNFELFDTGIANFGKPEILLIHRLNAEYNKTNIGHVIQVLNNWNVQYILVG